MKKLFLVFALFASLLASCNRNKSNNETSQTGVTEQKSDEIINGVETNLKGDKLEYAFNKTRNTATFILNGQKIEMVADNTKASGANYKNEQYTYTNRHGVTELQKDGKTIFYHNADLAETSVKNKEGKTLEMKFDNAKNTASFVFDGKTIELKADTTASGVKYSNKDYVFTEHQGKMELIKDGKAVFVHQK